MTKTYKMVQAARKSGGDRYECSDADAPVKVLYVEQKYSRPDGHTPLQWLNVEFNFTVVTAEDLMG